MAMHLAAFSVAASASEFVSFLTLEEALGGRRMSKHGNVVVIESLAADADDGGASSASALMTESQVAELLGVRPHTLAVWRSTRKVPLLYVKVGRAVRYRRTDVEAFLQAGAERCADEFIHQAIASPAPAS